MTIHLKILAALLAVIVGFLFFANFGVKRLLIKPQKTLVEQIQGEDNKKAVEQFVVTSHRNTARLMQQLMVVCILGLVAFMVFFQNTVLNRITSLHAKLRLFRIGQTSELPGAPGNDDVALLGGEINNLLKRNQILEEDLKFSETCFKAFVADNTELVCRLSHSGKLNYVNNFFCKFFGQRKEDLIGEPFANLLDAASRDLIDKQLNASPQVDIFDSDVQALNKKGQSKQIHWVWHSISSPSKQIIEYQGTGRDITREWDALKNLDRQRKVEQLLLNISTKLINQPTAEVDNGIDDVLKGIGEFLGADNAYIYRIRGNELTASHLWRSNQDIIPRLQSVPILLDELPWAAKRFKKGKMLLIRNPRDLPEDATAEKLFIEQVGVSSLIAVPFKYESELAGLLFFDFVSSEQTFEEEMELFLGITAEMISNALERKDAMLSLESGQQRLRTIFSTVQTGIFVTNLRNREIVDANDRACDMVGIPREELLGSLCMRVFDSLPAMPGTPREGISWNVEDKLKDRYGRRLPVLRTTVTIMMQDELHLVESVVDLSSQKKLEAQRMQNERLEGVLEMAGAACHELNQPLQVISGYADLLMMKMDTDDSNYSKIKVLSEQVKRLGDITGKINNITTYETQDYLSGKIIDIEKSGANADDEPFALPANRVNQLLGVLRRQKATDTNSNN